MKRLLLTILVVSTIWSQANAVGVVHTVSSLTSPPLVIPSTWAGDTVRFTGNLSSPSGVAITISTGADNLVIDGQNRIISFGTSGQNVARSGPGQGRGAGPKGISAGTITGLVVRNLTLTEGAPAESCQVQTFRTTDYGTWATGMAISPVRNALFENVTVIVAGGNAQCVRYDGTNRTTAGYNVTFRGCTFTSGITHFYSRTQWEEQSVVNLLAPFHRWGESDYQFHYKFVSCDFTGHWTLLHMHGYVDTAIAVVNKPLVIVDSCDFTIDHRNDNNSVTYPGWGTNNSGEAYCLSIRFGDQNSHHVNEDWDRVRVTNCTFTSGTSYGGGHGIFASGVDAPGNTDSMNTIYIAHNTFNIHHGRVLSASFIDGYGMKIREDPSNFWIEDNTITIVGNTEGVATSYGDNVIGIELNTPSNGGAPMTNGNSIRGIKIRKNRITAYSLAPQSAGDPEARCFQFSEYYTAGTYNNVLDSNVLVSNGTFYQLTGYNGPGGGGNTVIRGNSHAYYGGGTAPVGNSFYYFYGGLGGNGSLDGSGWVLQDGTFSNGILDVDGTVVSTEAGDRDLRLKYTLSPQVIGTNTLPVAGATVVVTDRFSYVVGSGTTGPNGRVSFLTSYRYFNKAPVRDTTTFNPLTIQVTKGTDTRTLIHTLAWDSRTPTITLLATVGADSIAPVVEYFTEDSVASLSATATIGIPRFQIAPLDSAGWLTAFVPPGYAEGGFTYEMYTTKNLDTSAWLDRWLNLAYGGNGSSRDFDHMHLSVYHDTIYGGCDIDDRYLMWELRGDSLWKIYSALWPVDSWTLIPSGEKTTLHNWAAWRLPASDSVLGFGRFSDEPKTGNVSWALSNDKGQTYGQASYFPNGNWSTFSGGNIRYGGGIFNNTVFAGYVRVLSGAGYLNWWEWNRATSSWTDLGHAIDMTTGGFHAIALGVTDTMRFAAQTKDGALVSGSYSDSIYSARRGKNTASWTAIPAVYAGNRGGSGQTSPYVALTHVNLTDRLIMFHSWCTDNTNATNAIAMRQWMPSTNRWSDPPIIVSRGQNAWKVTTAFETPESHGDVAYAQMICDSTIGSTTYRFSYIIRVTFSGLLPDVDPPAAIDTFAVVHDTSFSESYNLAAVVITFDPIPPISFSYNYTTANGTATAGQDYVLTTGTAVMNPPRFPPVDPDTPTSYKDTIYIPLLVDPNDEPDERFWFHITSTNPPNWEGPTSDLSCQVIILDNDEPVVLGDRRNRRIRK